MSLPTLAPASAAAVAPSGYRLEKVTLQFLDRAYSIEISSYPEDEAATREKLDLRIRKASSFFYGAFRVGSSEEISLVGFVCGTLVASETLTEEAMAKHDPAGTTLCIHSIVVEESLRRRGLATWMLQEYLQRVASETKTERVLLICKENLVGFYESCGFGFIGPSAVVHGQTPGVDMGLAIKKEI